MIQIFIRLIKQFERKSVSTVLTGTKKVLKPHPAKEKTTTKRRESWHEDSEGEDDHQEDDDNKEEETVVVRRAERKTTTSQKKDLKKPSFLVQTSSGRTPKATARYVAEGGSATADSSQQQASAKRPAGEPAAPKRVKLTGKANDVSTNAKICLTIKKVNGGHGSGESDSSFESTILGLEEDLKRLPASKGAKRKRVMKLKAKEEQEEMPPKLEPNYPDLKVRNTRYVTVG